MSASITLSRKIKKTPKGTVSLELMTTGFGISSKVFAIEVLPSSADAEAPCYRFSHVCSPAELVEFPEDEPFDNCYFRTDDIELVFDTDKMVEHVMANMRKDIANLVHEFNALDAMEAERIDEVFEESESIDGSDAQDDTEGAEGLSQDVPQAD